MYLSYTLYFWHHDRYITGVMTEEMLLQSNIVKQTAYDIGADAVGIAEVSPVANSHRFLKWLGDGCAGDMTYLARYMDQRFDPEKLLPGAGSIIVLGFNYNPTADDIAGQKAPYKVARYAWGKDYHNILRRKLKKLRGELRKIIPDLKARICVDTAPFMDKYWAQAAGLGWQGKHSNLVSRKFGNWLVIGSLVIDAVFDKYDRAHTDHCGRCTACIDACPTGAIERPYMVNASKCISYWTIESKKDAIPESISEKLGDWVFGCDICLSVCPFNRFERESRTSDFTRGERLELVETGRVMELTGEKFDEIFSNSPIKRPGLDGLKRNIAAVKKL